MKTMNSVGYKIKELREEKGLSQEELALELNTSQSNLCKIETGTNEKIDFLFMQRVCDLFQVDFDYFVEREKVVNKVKTNNGVVYNKGTFNNFPENLLDQIKYLIESNKEKNDEIEKLKAEIKTLEK